jgi:4-amino-4-deoxy-L-arabinose transferase-like glycosyltransferase
VAQEAERPEAASREPRLYFWFLALVSAVLLLAPLRTGDLAGYDDAHFAHIAKYVVLNGEWWNLTSNGGPALEHPPLFVWIEAALFKLFGFSDELARLPSALCGWGTILLVFWLARRMLGERGAVLAMFIMAASIYFLKYAARGMTDVPFTFLCLAALCAWLRGEEHPRWYLLAGLCAGMAQMTRGLMGIALPVTFAADALWNRRRPPAGYAIGAGVLAFLPVSVWYADMLQVYGSAFVKIHAAWLDREAFGELSPAWRRYTGAPEYIWMLAKSYWPWLPFMVVGLVDAVRVRPGRGPAPRPALRLLAIWIAVVFVLCAAAKSRVLRYMLPAYPAFAVLSAEGLERLVPPTYIWRAMRVLAPVAAIVVAAVAIFPPKNLHATEIRPIALAASDATPEGSRVAFYDAGQPRFDETNQLLWYGNRLLDILLTPKDLAEELARPGPRVFVVDRDTYRAYFAGRRAHQIVRESGHLVCLRVAG